MKQYQDERTLQVRNRIYAELMRIMLCVVVLSFCIKTLYFHMDLAQCMTEYILMILAPVYQAVRIRQTEVVLGRTIPHFVFVDESLDLPHRRDAIRARHELNPQTFSDDLETASTERACAPYAPCRLFDDPSGADRACCARQKSVGPRL